MMSLYLSAATLFLLVMLAVKDYRQFSLNEELSKVLLQEVYKPLNEQRLIERDIDIERAVLRCVGVLADDKASYRSKLRRLKSSK